MPRSTCLAAAVLVIAAISPGAQADEPAPGLPPEAARAIDARDWPKVVAALAEGAKDPKNGPAQFWTGLAELFQEHWSPAADALERALASDPGDRASALALAQCGEGLADVDRPAVSKAALAAFPLDAEVAHFAGREFLTYYARLSGEESAETGPEMRARRVQALETALEHLRRAELLEPGIPDNERLLAYALWRHGDHAEAAEHARHVHESGPCGWEVPLILAASLTELGRAQEAAPFYETAARLAPAHRSLMAFERGRALLDAGRYDDAVAAFRETLEAEIGFPYARHWLGVAALRAEDLSQALWALGQSREVDGLNDDVFLAGRCAYALGDDARAERLVTQAIDAVGRERAPAEWLHYLGRTQWAQGNRKDALQSLEAASAAAPGRTAFARWLLLAHLDAEDPLAAIAVCRRVADAGDLEAALQGMDTVMERFPKPRLADFQAGRPPHTSLALQTRAALHFTAGRYATSALFYEKVRETRGRHASIGAGWALALAGRPEAEATFRDYLEHAAEDAKDWGRYGIAYALLAKGKGAEATPFLEPISRAAMLRGRDTGLLWAAVAADDGKARARADAWTLLGVYDDRLKEGQGTEILGILPGGALASVEPRLRPRDLLVSLGDRPLDTPEGIEALRAGSVPTAPVTLRVRRGLSVFLVSVDYGPAVARVAAAGAGR